MSYYDWWVSEEKKKIHNEFEKKKEELLVKSLDAGFNEGNKNDTNQLNVSKEYSALDKLENEMINSFEKDPGNTTEKFMQFVNSNKSK